MLQARLQDPGSSREMQTTPVEASFDQWKPQYSNSIQYSSEYRSAEKDGDQGNGHVLNKHIMFNLHRVDRPWKVKYHWITLCDQNPRL